MNGSMQKSRSQPIREKSDYSRGFEDSPYQSNNQGLVNLIPKGWSSRKLRQVNRKNEVITTAKENRNMEFKQTEDSMCNIQTAESTNNGEKKAKRYQILVKKQENYQKMRQIRFKNEVLISKLSGKVTK